MVVAVSDPSLSGFPIRKIPWPFVFVRHSNHCITSGTRTRLRIFKRLRLLNPSTNLGAVFDTGDLGKWLETR